MSALPLRPLGFGEVLDCAFQLYRKNFAAYTSMALVGLLPARFVLILSWDATSALLDSLGDGAMPDLAAGGTATALTLLALLIMLLVDLALAVAMARGAAGDRVPGAKRCYMRGAARLHRLAGAAIVVAAVVMAAAGLWSVGGVVTALAATGGGLLVAVPLGIVWLAVGVLAAIWLAAGTAVLLPLVAVEKRGAMGCLLRSFRLARGAQLRSAGIIAVAGLMMMLPSAAVAAITGTWEQLVEGAAAVVGAGDTTLWLAEAALLVASSVTAPLWVACKTVLLHDRRVRAEGYDIEAAADALGG